jgi:hypothetical protein
MTNLDYTMQGRKPSTRQIIADWKKAGCPNEFEVNYGETFAEFTNIPGWKWDAHGNGCSGFKRDEVLKELNRIQS